MHTLNKLRILPLKDVLPQNDGITHINIYSRGKTSLGRYLSHFQHSPLETEDGHFESLEGYWYWLKYPDEQLRNKVGIEAKNYFHSLPEYFNNKTSIKLIEEKIIKATDIKIRTAPLDIQELFLQNQLPFIHAYYLNGGYSIQKSMDGIIRHLYQLRQQMLLEN